MDCMQELGLYARVSIQQYLRVYYKQALLYAYGIDIEQLR